MNIVRLAVLPLLAAVACGEPVRLDECQPSDSSLECTNCCDAYGYGDRPSSFTSATGRCTCYQARSGGDDGGGEGTVPAPLPGADARCWNFFNDVLVAECENVEIGPGINTCEANFCTDAGIGANRVDAECDAFIACWSDYDACMGECASDSSRIQTCDDALYACVSSKTQG